MPTPITIRQQIVTKVITQLKRIKTSNTYSIYGNTANYLTNAGDNVNEWRDAPFGPDELPALIVRDLSEPVIESPSPRSDRIVRQLHIQVEAVAIGDNPSADIRKMLADVEAAIGEGRLSEWNDISFNTKPLASKSVLKQESWKLAGGIFECVIEYPTLAFDSFNGVTG